MTLKIAVFAPIPRARVRTVMPVKSGIRARLRRTCFNRMAVLRASAPHGVQSNVQRSSTPRLVDEKAGLGVAIGEHGRPLRGALVAAGRKASAGSASRR